MYACTTSCAYTSLRVFPLTFCSNHLWTFVWMLFLAKLLTDVRTVLTVAKMTPEVFKVSRIVFHWFALIVMLSWKLEVAAGWRQLFLINFFSFFSKINKICATTSDFMNKTEGKVLKKIFVKYNFVQNFKLEIKLGLKWKSWEKFVSSPDATLRCVAANYPAMNQSLSKSIVYK